MCDKTFCLECNKLVTPIPEKEFQGEPGHGGWVEWYRCPECGEYDNFSSYTHCGQCSEPMPEGNTYCDSCIEEATEEFISWKNSMEMDKHYDSDLILEAITKYIENVND